MMRKAVIIYLAILLVGAVAVAQEEVTWSESLQRLESARESVKEMRDAGIPDQRVTDLYEQVNATFYAENRSLTPDYSSVVEGARQIESIRQIAFRVHDNLQILNETVKELRREGLNTSEVEQHFHNARIEFRNERFEAAQDQIEETYNAISNARALSTRAAAFSEAARQNIVSFIDRNKWRLLVWTVVLALLGIFGYREVRAFLLFRRKQRLQKRKTVLEELIAESQREYFEEGGLPEETYKTRMDKYGEMIRDINRQLPIIKEELEEKFTLTARFYA